MAGTCSANVAQPAERPSKVVLMTDVVLPLTRLRERMRHWYRWLTRRKPAQR